MEGEKENGKEKGSMNLNIDKETSHKFLTGEKPLRDRINSVKLNDMVPLIMVEMLSIGCVIRHTLTEVLQITLSTLTLHPTKLML